MASRETPATRVARRARVAFAVHEYEHDPRAESFGLEAAAALGVDPARVFKTLIAEVDGTLATCVVPVGSALDLRALGKRAVMADTGRAEKVTGYVAGGISPLGQRRALPAFVDDTALAHDTIYVSAGRRGLELELAPNDLVALTSAHVRPLRRGGQGAPG